MNNESLKGLHDYIVRLISENNIEYEVYEPKVIELYNSIIEGKVTRKDFLVYAICDMASALIWNGISIKSTQWVRFAREHEKELRKFGV